MNMIPKIIRDLYYQKVIPGGILLTKKKKDLFFSNKIKILDYWLITADEITKASQWVALVKQNKINRDPIF